MPVDTLDALAPHAERRGITAKELARRLLDVCAEEPTLIANVLDDEGQPA